MAQNDASMPQPGLTFPSPPFSPAPAAIDSNSGSGVFSLFRLIVFCAVPLLFVNGAFPQLQMLFLGGRVPISAAIVKVVVLGVFFLALVFRSGRFARNPRLVVAALLFFGYLLLDSLFFYFQVGQKPLDIATGFNAYYSISFVAVMAGLMRLRIKERDIVVLLCIVGIGCGILGLFQYIKQSPIVPVASSDNNFKVLVWSYEGKVRVFSLFESPQYCGLFYVFFSALMVALCRRFKTRLFAIPLLALSILLCLLSDARTQIASLFWAIIASAIITFWSGKNRVRWLPLYALLSALPIFLFALFAAGSGGSLYTRTGSFMQRIKEWTYFTGMLRGTDLSRLLFGLGLVQNGQITGSMYIDNIYLTVALHIGVVGLVLYLFLANRLWVEVRQNAVANASPLHTAVAATFSTFLLMGIFNIVPTALAAYFALYAISEVAQVKAETRAPQMSV